MKKRNRILTLFILMTVLLGACNLPRSGDTEDASSTAAAQTVQAFLTNTALIPVVPTLTFTPISIGPATSTTIPPTIPPPATATSNCNAMQFITDVTVPDDTVMTPNQAYTKTWRLKNIGTCAWTPSYAVVFSNGNQMGGPSTQNLAGNVNPGQTLDVTVNLTAPGSPDTYTGNWKLRDASGVLFGQFYVRIKVQNPAVATTAAPPPFAVTSVTFNVTGTCPNFHYTFTIVTNGPGTVTYHRVFSDGGTDTTPGTLVFSSAGSQTVGFDRYFGVAGSTAWTDIYIDTPNHQQFGRANFTCP